MSSSFSKLFILPELLHAKGCPVIIAAGALYKTDFGDEKLLVQLKFKNTGNKIVKAIKVAFQVFDVSENQIDEKIEHQYLDLNLGFNGEYSDRKGVLLETNTIRSFNAKITEIIFNNGDKWSDNVVFTQLPKPKKLINENNLGPILTVQYRREIGNHAEYEPFVFEDMWCCTCGEYNRIDESNCHKCKTEKIKQIKYLDHSLLAANREAFEKEELAKAAKEAKRKLEQKEKVTNTIKKAITALVVVLIIGVSGKVAYNLISDLMDYKSATALMDEGKYAEAISAFEKLGDFKECKTNILECKYLEANKHMEDSKYYLAISEFEKISDYKDSKDKISECKYQGAVQDLDKKDYQGAISSFVDLGDYKDSAKQKKKAQYLYAISLLGTDDTKARGLFLSLDNYKDSEKYLKSFSYLLVRKDNSYYSYNTKGQILTVEYKQTLSAFCNRYYYNDKGYLIKIEKLCKKHYDNGFKVYETEKFEYDRKGNCIKESILRDSSSKIRTTYTYNSKNQRITEEGSLYKYKYFYNEKNQLIKAIKYYSDSYTPKVTYLYEYDEYGNVIKEQPYPEDLLGESLCNWEYTYDTKGNIIKAIVRCNKQESTLEYEYDYVYTPDLKK